MELDESRIGFLPVLRHLEQPTLDFTRFVFNAVLERANESVDAKSIPAEVVGDLALGHRLHNRAWRIVRLLRHRR